MVKQYETTPLWQLTLPNRYLGILVRFTESFHDDRSFDTQFHSLLGWRSKSARNPWIPQLVRKASCDSLSSLLTRNQEGSWSDKCVS